VLKLKDCESNMAQVSDVVKRLLDLFDRYDIHCTWAVVGLLNMENTEELKDFKAIEYSTKNYSPFPISKYKLDTVNESVFLAKNDIESIKTAKHQELASHTFSHYYTLENGQTEADFKADLNSFSQAMGDDIKSIVFPRNQINKAYLKLCSDKGMTAYRGNQNNKFWKNSAYKKESLLQKIGRTTDAYLKISKDNLIDWDDLKYTQNGLINISASRFFKPYQFPKLIENLKLNRIKKQMLKSAQTNTIYHLWWHPHNFTTNTDANFKQLESIFVYYQQLVKEHEYQSLNMNEIANQVE
jgi:peptidoglycan/xylan/chitin deacetylase (PgdA/CDA1 family)